MGRNRGGQSPPITKITITKREKNTRKNQNNMKTKLTKTIMSSLAFTCALVCMVAVIAVGTSGTAGGAAHPPDFSGGPLRGGVCLWSLAGVHKIGGEPAATALFRTTPL